MKLIVTSFVGLGLGGGVRVVETDTDQDSERLWVSVVVSEIVVVPESVDDNVNETEPLEEVEIDADIVDEEL